MGVCPGAHPRAVGILSVGMLPCGRAAGIAGVAPTAGSCAPPCSRRHRIAAAPISATSFAKMPDRLIALPPLIARMLSSIARKSHMEFATAAAAGFTAGDVQLPAFSLRGNDI